MRLVTVKFDHTKSKFITFNHVTKDTFLNFSTTTTSLIKYNYIFGMRSIRAIYLSTQNKIINCWC
jgi:hypothetical protein